MGIIQYIKDKQTEKRLTKLKGDLLMIQKDLEFNPFNAGLPSYLSELKYANFELIENMVWGSGNGSAIRQFYRTSAKEYYKSDYDPRKTYFAATCPDNYRYVHIGLPKLISESMSALIWGNGYVFNTEVYTDKEKTKKDDDKSSNYNKALYQLLEKNVMADKLLQAGYNESVAGDVAFKVSFDFKLSPLPIIEVVDRRYYEVEQSRGIVSAFVFKSYYEVKDKSNNMQNYVFKEIYTHNEEGNAVILSKLYLHHLNGSEEEVPLTSIAETAEVQPEITLNYKGDLAWHKKNKEYTGIIANYPYGSSDYANKDNFDNADESATAIVAEARENKTLRFFDPELLKVDDKGNFENINHFITNYVMSPRDQDQNHKDTKQEFFQDKTEQHLKKLQIAIEMACADCKISPISLGLSGTIANTSSDETLRERTSISRDTATKKKNLWIAFLDIMLPEVMKFAKYLTEQTNYPNTSEAESFKNLIKDIDIEMATISTSITPYDVKSIEDNLTTWGAAKQSGMASIENAVRQVYGSTMTEEELLEEVNRIKIEQNIAFDNPDLLQLNNEDTE